MQISGTTRIAALFGFPVEHTLSPFMQNAAFEHAGLDVRYVPFSVSPKGLKPAVEAISALNLFGVNLTIPHKEAVIPMLDRISDEASAIGAVNTITVHDGMRTGHNTDGRGFLKSLEEGGIDFAGKSVLILGAGGAARAVAYHLCRKAGSLSVHNRNAARAADLASFISASGGTPRIISDLSNATGFDLIVNATPLGLRPDDPLPYDATLLTPAQAVCDLIYRETPLLSRARQAGCRTVSGIGMLLWQGAYAFELWTGMTPPIEVMRTALLGFVK